MGGAPFPIKLRCQSWSQLRAIYQRDLCRGALFLRSSRPPPIGTPVRVDLALPSDSIVVLKGHVQAHIRVGGMEGRGPGIDIAFGTIPHSAIWLIESALKSASKGGLPQDNDGGRTAAMEDGADLADAERELVDALKAEYESLRRLNPFQILGVSHDSSDEAVRTAFGALTRRYHPDRFARYQSHEARRYASEIFILIRNAYRKLGSQQARDKVRQALETGRRASAAKAAKHRQTPPRGVRAMPNTREATPARPSPPGPTVPPAPQGIGFAGDGLLDGERAASTAEPLEGGNQARAYGEAEALVASGQHDAALAIYRAGLEKNASDAQARAGIELVEGLLALAQRDRLEAAQRFEAALELDPGCERAALELADMRRIATSERKGLLARLLGKKE